MSGGKERSYMVKFAGVFSTYDLLLPPGINQLTQLNMHKIYKINNCIQTFEKTTTNIKKECMVRQHVLL